MSTTTTTTGTPITTIIFDVDDTLYDVGSGFTAHRCGDAVQEFMMEKLGFPDMESAKAVQRKYFAMYHSTSKGLTVAEKEGQFPKKSDSPDKPLFETQDLSTWWAERLDYSMISAKSTDFQDELRGLAKSVKILAFSNGPRKYVQRVLKELDLTEFFGDESLYCVDDVLPHCKPEKEAFQKIFDTAGVKAEECIMVEDSMKNIRCAKALGMKTILIKGIQKAENSANIAASEETKPGDAPKDSDPAVDVTLESVEQLKKVLPGLCKEQPVFA